MPPPTRGGWGARSRDRKRLPGRVALDFGRLRARGGGVRRSGPEAGRPAATRPPGNLPAAARGRPAAPMRTTARVVRRGGPSVWGRSVTTSGRPSPGVGRWGQIVTPGRPVFPPNAGPSPASRPAARSSMGNGPSIGLIIYRLATENVTPVIPAGINPAARYRRLAKSPLPPSSFAWYCLRCRTTMKTHPENPIFETQKR